MQPRQMREDLEAGAAERDVLHRTEPAQAVRSSIGAPGASFLTDSIPCSMAEVEE